MKVIGIIPYIPSAIACLVAVYCAIASLMALIGLNIGAFIIGCIITVLVLGLANKLWPR
jgi:hypothetical protein